MEENVNLEGTRSKDENFKYKAGIFLASVTGMSALVGFGSTLAAAKRKDPTFFDKGITRTEAMAGDGAALALRALGWGTLYAVGGVGLICFGIWKLSGAKDLKEFRTVMGSVLPRIPKSDPPVGRTEFEGLSDLLQYISESGNSKSSPKS